MNKEKREESWNFVDLLADYKRMGVPNNLWVATAVNGDYRVSFMCGVVSTQQSINICDKANALISLNTKILITVGLLVSTPEIIVLK